MASTPKHILIIGGGVAGNALALFLLQASSHPLTRQTFTFSIFEAYPRSEKVYIGGGLGLAPNGVQILATLGLEDEIKKRTGVAKRSIFWNETGSELAGWEHEGLDWDFYGMMRSTLYDILSEELGKKGLSIEYEKKAVKVQESGDKVIVEFKDGSIAEGDYLIACDGIPSKRGILMTGIHSVVREQIFPGYPKPEFIGLNGAGGLVVKENIPNGIPPRMKDTMNFIFGKNAFFGVAPSSDGVIALQTSQG
jgi:flavin-dependent dehydrogenase